jgi:signal transduction histidine kinase
VRWVGFAVCLVAAVSEILQDPNTGTLRPLAPALMLRFACSLAYAGLFFRNTREMAGSDRWLLWTLPAQVLAGFALIGVSPLTVITVVLAVPAGRRRPWFALCIGVYLAAVAYTVYDTWSEFVKAPGGISLTAVGVFEALVWDVFSYYAALLIMKTESDRRTLAGLYNELFALQQVLRESSRFEERLRISRELHDSIGHYLTSQSIQLEIAAFHANDEVRDPLSRAQLLGRLMLSEIRNAVNSWQEERSTALGPALRQLTGGVSGVSVHCEIDEELPLSSPSVAHALFRCAQEAVTNCLRHARATQLWLSLKCVEGEIRLDVRDDGAGCDVIRSGNGLNGIQARAEEMKGRLTLESAAGRGFRMSLAVPAANWGAS